MEHPPTSNQVSNENMINLPFQERQDAWQIKLYEIPAGRILEFVQKKNTAWWLARLHANG
jgi:hypothetical protein